MANTRELESERQREHAKAQRLARAIDRETESALRRASARSRRAVAAVLADQRENESSSRQGVARAWARAPGPIVSAAIASASASGWSRRAGGGASRPLAGNTDPRHATFHFKLHETRDGGAARAHQRYIEREGATVSSLGNLASTQAERERLWEAVAERASDKSGKIQLDFTNEPELATQVLISLSDWTHARLLTAPAARAVAVRARATLQKHEAETPAELQELVQEAVNQADSQPDQPHEELSPGTKRRRKHLEKKAPEHSVTLWVRDADLHRETQERIQSWLREEDRKKRLKVRRPRQPVIQRRLVLELAHELDDDARERAVQTWCENTLGRAGVGWHAAIHAPENSNDERNYHAHVVYTQFALEREPDHARWTFEEDTRLPPPAPVIKVLSGNGPEKRKGRNDLIRAWRAEWAEVQNKELEAVGASKRYEPRSYREQGRPDIIPGRHRGTVQSAIETRGGVAAATPEASETQWERLASHLVWA